MSWIAPLRRSIVAGPPRGLPLILWMLVAIAVPTGLRALIGPSIGGGLPFATYYPAVLAATLFLGWRPAALTTLASAVLVNYLFITPHFSPRTASPRDFAAVLLFLATAGAVVAAAEALRRTVVELELRARRESDLNAELQHRVKNNLAVVQALALQTARARPSPDAFYAAFEGRLRALAQAHDILSTGHWQGCELPELAVEALRPFGGQGAVRIAGPAAVLPVAACVPLVLALHELGTNAAKYGALSTTAGRVEVGWALSPAGVLTLRWAESGGPRVKTPTRQGLGSKLLARQQGIAAARLDFPPEGVVCEIEIEGARPG